MEIVRGLLVLLFILIVGCVLSVINAEEIITAEKSQKIILEKTSNVSKSFVRLRDLTKSTIDKKLGNILLSRRPPSNKPITMQRFLIEKLIKNQNASADLNQFEIPEEIVIHYVSKNNKNIYRTNASMKGAELNQDDKSKVAKINMNEVLLMVTKEVEFKLKSYSPQVALYLPKNKPEWKVKVKEGYDLKVLPGLAIYKNRIIVKMGVFSEKKMIVSEAFSFKADIFIKALMTTAKYNKGDKITTTTFNMDYTPYSSTALSYVRDEALLKNKVFKRNIALGIGVSLADIGDPTLIKKDDLVTILVKGDGYSIETYGIAKKSGKKGELIEVMIYSTKKVVPCSITGNKKVKLL